MAIKDILETQRRTLLDLTYRNRLLNLPKRTSSRTINVVDEISSEVFRLLVTERKSMSFLPARLGEEEDTGERATEPGSADEAESDIVHFQQPDDGENDPRAVASRHSDTKLQTRLASEHLQKRLLAIHYDAQLMMEEQGVNVLFLTLGRLRYREPGERAEEHSAPLLMLPVTLERQSARERFHLRWNEEDPGINLSLQEKLRTDFGIKLPEYSIDDDPNVDHLISRIQQAVAGQDGWSVDANSIQLGFFSFSKLLMFMDLDPERWPKDARLDQHPLIDRLLGAGFAEDDRVLPDNTHLDEVVGPENLVHIMDCDSSQALAIESVRRAANLVIQGPPGTGKSQTIANLIATLVKDGKKVLFVAEKMAALEVVKRRMTSAGLGPLCLELHSNKANKKSLLEELSKTLSLGAPLKGDADSLLRQLRESRDALNAHAGAMHQAVGASALSVFRVVGELSKRAGQPRPPFRLTESTMWTTEEAGKRLATLLEVRRTRARIGDPKNHVWRGAQSPQLLRPQIEDLCDKAGEAADKLKLARELAAKLADALRLREARTYREIEQQCSIAEQLAKAPKFDRQALSSEIWQAGLDSLRDALRHGEALSGVLTRRQHQLVETALNLDWLKARQIMAAKGKSLFRFLSADYRGSLNELRSLLREPLPKSYEERIQLLDDLILGHKAKQAVARLRDTARNAFGQVWKDENTDWKLAGSIIEWVHQNARPVAEINLREVAQRVESPAELPALVREVRGACAAAGKAASSVITAAGVSLKEAFAEESLTNIAMDELLERCRTWSTSVDGFADWASFHEALTNAKKLGMADSVAALDAQAAAWSDVEAHYWHAFYLAHLDAASKAYPGLTRFDGRRHDGLVERFRRLDRERQGLASIEASLAHYQSLPKAMGEYGALGVLRGEIAKKRGHMPIRKLLKHCGSAIQAAKPVFMMSPMSIAQFLEPGAISFDVLIIDEASQVEPVDALGAIARCRQIVVVGDDKQLPPTSFFSRLVESDESEEIIGAQVSDLESVLSLCAARGVSQRMLKWHYRSRHESLIAVSNKEFYDGGLFIVPSPDKDKSYLGLKFHYVEHGRFDRGNTGRNKAEAVEIARAVIQHALSNPELTLGVGAMSVRQRDAILDEIELLRREHPETERFFADHPHEPFFVKNLENIQGDERDVIFISVGYGRSQADDKMRQNFGPLNSDGGHRRLNVLITRAKLRCEVFSSIRADEIRLDETTKLGVAALKAFLSYAETGSLAINQFTNKGPDSPFEEAVHAALQRQGLEVHNQVGVAGFFIDLAVVDREMPGRYILGIECDGATYHSSRSARDRDRLRQEILESQGWHIHRIWSTDWFQREAQERDRLMRAVSSAKATRRPVALPSSQPGSRSPGQEGSSKESAQSIRRLGPTSTNGTSSLPGVLKYTEAEVELKPGTPAPHLVEVESMAAIVEDIVKIEGPVHAEEITSRVREGWGLQRAGSRIQGAVGDAIDYLVRRHRLKQDGDFYTIPGQEIPVRDRSQAESRSLKKPELLPPAEIRRAILLVAEHSHGISRDELPTAVARTLGFSATSQQLREMILKQATAVLKAGKLERSDDLLRPSAG